MSLKAFRHQCGFSLIELLIVVAIIAIIAGIALPNLRHTLKTGREMAAISSLKTIYGNQASYNAAKGRFGTLKELASAGYLLDQSYASGRPVSRYVYSDSDVSADTYCVHADRESDGSGDRDFNVTEVGVVHYVASKTRGTVARGEGTPITAAEGGPETSRPPE